MKMKLIALFVIVVAVGCISAEPFLGSLLKTNPLLNGVTKTLTGVGGIVKNTIDTVTDVVKGLICLLDGLLDSVKKITNVLPTIIGSVAPVLNKLTGVLCGVFSKLIENANNLNGIIKCNTDVVGSALKTVGLSVTELVQIVNIAVETLTHNTENRDSILCSMDHGVLDLAAAVADLIQSVVKVISAITGPINNDVPKVLCSLHLLLKTVLAIVGDILSNVSCLLAKLHLPQSNVLSSINCQLSKNLADVSKIVDKIKSGKCVVSELVSSLNEIVGSLSNTLQSLTEAIGCIVGNLTPVLNELTSDLNVLPHGNADIEPSVYKELVNALNGAFEPIEQAVSAVTDVVSEAEGLTDVSVKNVKTSIIIGIQAIGSITSENIQQAGGENGIDKHLSICNLQMITLLQRAVDSIIFLAKNILFSAKVANVLIRIVWSMVAAVKTVITTVAGLLEALINAVDDEVSNVNNIVTLALQSITCDFSDDSGTLGQALSGLSAAGDCLTHPDVDLVTDVDVSACALSGLNGSLTAVSGSICGTLSGITSALGGLTKNPGCVVNETAEPVVPGSLQDLLDRMKPSNIVALNEVACWTSQIEQTLGAVISSLDAVNGGCGCEQ